MAHLARQLAALALNSASNATLAAAAPASVCGLTASLFKRGFASSSANQAFSRKDVAYNLDNASDPEAEAAIKAFQRQQFAAASKGGAGAAPAEPATELADKIERKYMAAQIIESGIQNVAVPLSHDTDGSGAAAMKRYIAQLQNVGAQAGFAAPADELKAKISEATAGAESVKEVLNAIKPYTGAAYHAALSEALAEVEAETGGAVTVDGASEGYKKFAGKVKAVAQSHKLPWQMLLPVQQKMATADEDTADKLRKDYNAWLQSAALADAQAEIEELRAEAARLIDTQLSKSAAAVKKEEQAALAAVARKLESAAGTPWADAYKKDLEYTAWFDAAVAADPKAGPKAATA